MPPRKFIYHDIRDGEFRFDIGYAPSNKATDFPKKLFLHLHAKDASQPDEYRSLFFTDAELAKSGEQVIPEGYISVRRQKDLINLL